VHRDADQPAVTALRKNPVIDAGVLKKTSDSLFESKLFCGAAVGFSRHGVYPAYLTGGLSIWVSLGVEIVGKAVFSVS
jgi:hypothetical protein